MTTLAFEYVAVDRAGLRQRGVARAASQADVYRQVAATGLTPVSIRPARESLARSRRRVRTTDIAHFTYQFAALIAARIPVSDGLLSIAQQEPSARLRHVLTDAAARIQAGERIADALEAHADVFGEVYVRTVRVAEQTGNMTTVLEHLCEMLERSEEVSHRIRSALMYPACVLVVLAVGVSFLVGFVIPKFARMFQSRGVELPAFTRLLMAIGESVQAYWWAYLGALALAVFTVRWGWGRPALRTRMDGLLHRIPFLRDVLRGLAISRFSRVFGLSLSSGLGLIDSLALAGDACGRPSLARDAQTMAEQVRTGGRLSDVLSACGYLTPFVRRMLTAGEEAGELPRMCSAVSRHYDRETMYLTRNLVTIIEPVMVVTVAGVVLVVALAIFLPMWNMVKVVG